jgi:hypothetical protein
MGSLSLEPLLAPALWLALAGAAAALLAWYGLHRPAAVTRRRWGGILALTALGLAAVLLILLNPTWVEPLTPPAGQPVLTVLLDATASMAVPDAEGRSRYAAAADLARACVGELAGRFDVQVRTFPDPTAARPDGPITDLAAALTEALADDRPQGQALLLLSDGIHNAGGGSARVLEAARLARAKAVPVYTRTFGGDAKVKDLAVEPRSPQELAFAGQAVTASVRLRQRGLAGASVPLTLLLDGKEVGKQTVQLGDGEAAEVRFELKQARAGLYRYEVQAAEQPGEASTVNNRATVLLRVVDQPVRLLLLEGKPYWDAKFLVRTLALDPALEVESLVRLADGRFLRRTLRRGGAGAQDEWKILPAPAEALTPEALRGYQLLVLGRDADVFLTDAVLGQLRTWLGRDGGSLVCYRGQPTAQVGQRLAQLLPVRWAPTREARFQVQLTDRGKDLQWFPGAGTLGPAEVLARLPTLAVTARPEQPRPLAVVVATGKGGPAEADSPVVSYQPYGSGRVVVLEGAGLWRWAFLPPQQQDQDDVYRGLWHGLLRWLVSSTDLLPGQKLALRSDKLSFGSTEAATGTLVLRDETGGPPKVQLLAETGQPLQTVTPTPLGDEPGSYRVSFGKLKEGRYLARVDGAAAEPAGTTAFDVRSLFEEQLDLQARPDLMARIAADSGGVALTADRPGEVADAYREHLERSRPPRVRRLSAWDRWWVLVGVIGLWGAAWALRRSGGLI